MSRARALVGERASTCAPRRPRRHHRRRPRKFCDSAQSPAQSARAAPGSARPRLCCHVRPSVQPWHRRPAGVSSAARRRRHPAAPTALRRHIRKRARNRGSQRESERAHLAALEAHVIIKIIVVVVGGGLALGALTFESGLECLRPSRGRSGCAPSRRAAVRAAAAVRIARVVVIVIAAARAAFIIVGRACGRGRRGRTCLRACGSGHRPLRPSRRPRAPGRPRAPSAPR